MPIYCNGLLTFSRFPSATYVISHLGDLNISSTHRTFYRRQEARSSRFRHPVLTKIDPKPLVHKTCCKEYMSCDPGFSFVRVVLWIQMIGFYDIQTLSSVLTDEVVKIRVSCSLKLSRRSDRRLCQLSCNDF